MLSRVVILLAALAGSAGAEELRTPQKLTVALSDELLGQLAPDGRRLYFVSNRNATSQIFTQDLTAPASTLLFDEGADATWPRVSPDGKWLAYISFRDDATGQLCLRDLPSLSRRCLDGGGALETSWGSPSELVLLSRGSVEGDLQLRRVRVDSKTLRATPLLSRNLNGPEVSPDGSWLVYVPLQRAAVRIGPAFAAQASRALVLRRLADGVETTVQLDLPGGASQPTFSADGRWLYFTQFLNDTDQNGVLDGDDHGVIFRVAFSGDAAALARAVPEQLTSADLNCQYPAPSTERLILTCAREGSLDLYSLPLDGQVPSAWTAARVREEMEASRDRWQRLMLLHRLERGERDAAAQATLLLEVVRLHLLLGEYEAAVFHARALGAAAAPPLAALAPLLDPFIAERRALRAFDRGELGFQYLEGARQRLALLEALAPAEPAAVALRHLILSELHDHLGDKDGAVAELGRTAVDERTPPFVVEALAARAETLYRELDRNPALLDALRPLVDHPLLPEAERLRLGGVYARTVMRGLPSGAAHAAAARERAAAPPSSARAWSLGLWPCLDDVAAQTMAAGRACVNALYDGDRSMTRRRLLVTEVVRRAEEADADDLEYELVRRWVHDVPNDAAEERHAERLFRHVTEDYAYDALAAGRPADAAAEFEGVTKEALSLEAHVGFIEASIAAGREVEQVYTARYRGGAVESRFVRAYLDVRRLPDLDGAAFDRAWPAASRDVQAIERELPQQAEVQALHGALLHLRFLRAGDHAAAEEANTHYLLALDLASGNERYRAMVLEELALLHAAVGNHRIALGHFDERGKLPFADPRAGLAHGLLRARSLLHVGHDADAARAAADALELAMKSPALARYRPLALDRAALYALDAGQGAQALALYDRADAGADAHEDARNRVLRWLGRAGAAVVAAQPARALADLDRVDRALTDPAVWRALDWPEAVHDEERQTYELLRLGLRGNAERALGRLDDAERTLGARHQLREARARLRSVDDDLLALATTDAQLADLARARGNKPQAAQRITEALAHADAYARKSGAPLDDAQLAVLGLAAELHLVAGVPASAFGFDVRARLQSALVEMAHSRDPARRDMRVRFGVYLTLIGLDR